MEANTNSRRNFLKKAAYAAPAVIALGTLASPQTVHASYVYVGKLDNNKLTTPRSADIYRENDGTQWMKTVEDDAYVKETLVHTSERTWTNWFLSFLGFSI